MIRLPQFDPAGPAPSIDRVTGGTPYASYAYSYPHKSAYGPLAPPRLLADVWAGEPKDALYLYLHVPFCEMRCGFCNLFTTANPRQELAAAYLSALWRQARRVRGAVGPARIARVAVGGGTPTWLEAGQLEQVLRVAEDLFGAGVGRVPVSVETSPRTASADKLRVLRDHGVDRVSIGVQSMVDAEVNASGRAQKAEWVESAIGRIRGLGFPTLNVDLIYGLPGQTVRTWLHSLSAVLRWRPEELYLYPLYVRPLTGLGRWGGRAEDAPRLECYRRGRDLLGAEGYRQVSMRMFRRADRDAPDDDEDGDGDGDRPVYCCQDDGMVGLGCGARSYTRALHYSAEYAVGAAGVRDIIADYVARPDEAFDRADYGCDLDEAEQKRRWAIKSLLRARGMDLPAWRRRFNSDARADLPGLAELEEAGLLETAGDHLRPTPAGLERSDAIGPWLYSALVRARMDHCELR